ncbi:ABC transporter substrate-binding protein [Streptomyces sp. NPDC087851]|uniref:peptide ABC transporter substrate-binding protein n=1 Tax=Streptomyces sp. NPDC087851 TaxID=3365810 RepID=UPI00380558FC
MRRSSMSKTVPASAVLAVLLAGCAGGGEDNRGSSPAGFSVAVGEPDHLTPGRSTVAAYQVRALFAPLVKVDTEGKLSYVQAESVTSSDARHWTVKLRSGWTFHNGEPVTARSYADAWNATAYGPNAWAANGQFAGVEGYAALNPAKGEPATKKLSGVKAVDDTTLKVTLTAPDSQFPLQLTPNQVGFYPLPKAAYKDLAAFDRRPIGNGPFKMSGTWEPNRGATVTAYAGYRGPKPASPSITFRSYTDLQTAYTDAQAGTLDVTGVPVSKYAQARTDFPGRVHTYEAPSLEFLNLPLHDPRFRNPDLRRALSMSINRSTVNKTMYGGLYTPATSLTPPSEVGAKTGVCDACGYDPEGAKALLRKAGGWSGPMVLTYPGGLGLDELYKALANQIRQNLGLADVTAQPTADWSEFSEKSIGKKLTGPSYGHWGALYPSMQNTLRGIFTEAGGCMCAHYSEPEVDALLNRADSSRDPATAERLYNEAQERALEDFPVVPLFYGTYVYVATERVSGVTVGPADLELDRIRVTG